MMGSAAGGQGRGMLQSHPERLIGDTPCRAAPMLAWPVEAPLVEECYANLECRIADSRLVNKYNFFILDAVTAGINPLIKDPRTLHHRGKGVFMLAGESLALPSRMK
jgi:flavin reductase (DIM6/NTAB) family NADH-FMN oxidoreductase RutF